MDDNKTLSCIEAYRNPLGVSRDELIEKVIYFPVFMAKTLQSHRIEELGNKAKSDSSLLNYLKSTLESKQKEDATQKMNDVDRNARLANCEGNKNVIPVSVFTEQLGLQSCGKQGETFSDIEMANSEPEGVTGEEVREVNNAAIFCDSVCAVAEKSSMENYDGKEFVNDYALSGPLSSGKEEIKQQIDYLVTAIRFLRKAKSTNSKELFDLLSSSHVPLDKGHLLEQLIWMAKQYNKKAIAEELIRYKFTMNAQA